MTTLNVDRTLARLLITYRTARLAHQDALRRIAAGEVSKETLDAFDRAQRAEESAAQALAAHVSTELQEVG